MSKRNLPQPFEIGKLRFRDCFTALMTVSVLTVGTHTISRGILFTRAPWHPKKHITFSDMLAAARRSHMTQRILFEPGQQQDMMKFNVARSTRRRHCRQRAKL